MSCLVSSPKFSDKNLKEILKYQLKSQYNYSTKVVISEEAKAFVRKHLQLNLNTVLIIILVFKFRIF